MTNFIAGRIDSASRRNGPGLDSGRIGKDVAEPGSQFSCPLTVAVATEAERFGAQRPRVKIVESLCVLVASTIHSRQCSSFGVQLVPELPKARVHHACAVAEFGEVHKTVPLGFGQADAVSSEQWHWVHRNKERFEAVSWRSSTEQQGQLAWWFAGRGGAKECGCERQPRAPGDGPLSPRSQTDFSSR